MRQRLISLFTLRTRFDVFCAIYAVALGAAVRGQAYLAIFPGWFGWLMMAACLGVVFIVGAKLLDAVRPPVAAARTKRAAPARTAWRSPRHRRPHPGDRRAGAPADPLLRRRR